MNPSMIAASLQAVQEAYTADPVLDPSQGGSQHATPVGTPSLAAASPAPSTGTPEPKTKKPRKKAIAPGSAADFRRKEANRLAAERSRMRASEKVKGIQYNLDLATEENKRLVREIEELEAAARARGVNLSGVLGEGGEQNGQGGEERQARGQGGEEGLGQGQVRGRESGHVDAGGDDQDHDAAEAQSRDIIAALLNGGLVGYDGFGEATHPVAGQEGRMQQASTWPDTVSSLVPSNDLVPSDGSVQAGAADHNDATKTSANMNQGEQSHTAPPSPFIRPGSPSFSTPASPVHTPASSAAPSSLPTTSAPHPPSHVQKSKPSTRKRKPNLSFIYDPSAALTSICSSVAVLLNAEMEKSLRDDVAASRESVAGLEKEVERLRREIMREDGWDERGRDRQGEGEQDGERQEDRDRPDDDEGRGQTPEGDVAGRERGDTPAPAHDTDDATASDHTGRRTKTHRPPFSTPSPLPPTTFGPLATLRTSISTHTAETATLVARIPRAQEDVALFRTLKVAEEARLCGVVRMYLKVDAEEAAGAADDGHTGEANIGAAAGGGADAGAVVSMGGQAPCEAAGGAGDKRSRNLNPDQNTKYKEAKKHHVANVRAELKGLGGYLGSIVWGPKDHPTEAPIDPTAYSTPAIARRRRGRPPKVPTHAKQSHSMLYPSHAHAPATPSNLGPSNLAAPSPGSFAESGTLAGFMEQEGGVDQARASLGFDEPGRDGSGRRVDKETAGQGTGKEQDGKGRAQTAAAAAVTAGEGGQQQEASSPSVGRAENARSFSSEQAAQPRRDGQESSSTIEDSDQILHQSGSNEQVIRDGHADDEEGQAQAQAIVKHLRATLASAVGEAVHDAVVEDTSFAVDAHSASTSRLPPLEPRDRQRGDGRASADRPADEGSDADHVLEQLKKSGEAFASLLRSPMNDASAEGSGGLQAGEDGARAGVSIGARRSYETTRPAASRRKDTTATAEGTRQEDAELLQDGMDGEFDLITTADLETDTQQPSVVEGEEGEEGEEEMEGEGETTSIPVNATDPLEPDVLNRLRKGPTGSCDICARTASSVWRRMIIGGEAFRVCNACGLYHKKFGVIRPAALWGDGGSFQKRRPARGPDEDKRRIKRSRLQTGDDDESASSPDGYMHGPGNNLAHVGPHVGRECARQPTGAIDFLGARREEGSGAEAPDRRRTDEQGHDSATGQGVERGNAQWGFDDEQDVNVANNNGKVSAGPSTSTRSKGRGGSSSTSRTSRSLSKHTPRPNFADAVQTAVNISNASGVAEFDPSSEIDLSFLSASARQEREAREGSGSRGHYAAASDPQHGLPPSAMGEGEQGEEVEGAAGAKKRALDAIARAEYDIAHHRFDPQHHYIREAQRAVEQAARQYQDEQVTQQQRQQQQQMSELADLPDGLQLQQQSQQVHALQPLESMDSMDSMDQVYGHVGQYYDGQVMAQYDVHQAYNPHGHAHIQQYDPNQHQQPQQYTQQQQAVYAPYSDPHTQLDPNDPMVQHQLQQFQQHQHQHQQQQMVPGLQDDMTGMELDVDDVAVSPDLMAVFGVGHLS